MANGDRSSNNHIIHNHLENIKSITSKTGLVYSLRRYYKRNAASATFGYTINDTIPISYIVLSHYEDAEFQAFMQYFKEISIGKYDPNKVPSKHCIENIWLIKPANMNQGQGIQVFKNSLDEMNTFLKSKPPFTKWVIQKYLERPLLYNGRKFDIRMWAVLTGKNELYYYPHGYVRTSSYFYSLNTNENYVHLTNNCLQQYGDKYGIFEEGNTLPLECLAKYIKEKFPSSNINFEEDILGRIKDLMIDVCLSAKYDINPTRRRNCFELLGFDFMIDEDLRVWLIEANTNPYLGIPNKFIEGLLPKMLNDLLEIVCDPYITPINPLPRKDYENQFELLYDERRKVNLRRNFGISLYPLEKTHISATPDVKKTTAEEKLQTTNKSLLLVF